MAMSIEVKRYPRVLFAVFLLLLIPFQGVYGSAGQQRKPTTKTLRDTHTKLGNDPKASLPSMFTICVSVLVTAHQNYPKLFILLGDDGNRWFDVSINPLRQFFGKRFRYMRFNRFGKIDTFPVFPNQWVRSCLSLNTVTGSVQWVARGELVDNSTIHEITSNVPTDLKEKVKLENFYKLANLEIYSSALTVETMQEYTRGAGCGDEGDYLSWQEMQWKLSDDAVVEHLDAEQPCYDQSWNFYPAQFPSMELCMHFCQNLGGRVPPVTTLIQRERLESFFHNKLASPEVWLPIDDKLNDGEWRDFFDHQKLNYTPPWRNGEPNGGTTENCVRARMRNDVISWSDSTCENYHTGQCVCERAPSLFLELRGLCANSAIDKQYHPWNNFSSFNDMKLVGLRGFSVVRRNKWNLSKPGSSVMGFSRAAHHTYVLGKHEWSIIGDSGCSSAEEKYTTHLKLTSCKKGNFTCDDGQCVTMEQR